MGRERILTWRGHRGRGLKLEAPRRESDLHVGSETRERAPGDGLEDTARGGGVCTEGHHPGLQQAGPVPGGPVALRLDLRALEQEFGS